MTSNWHKRYQPPTTLNWQGRRDGPRALRFHEKIQCLDLREELDVDPKGHSFAILGFACDEGIKRNCGRVGAASGPEHIRASLAKLLLHNTNVHLYDVGDITCSDGDLESSQQALAEVVSLLLQANVRPILLGGGHSIALGHYQGIAPHYPGCAIINFDAHYDLRPLAEDGKGSSGTPFTQIANLDSPFHYTCIGIQEQSNSGDLFKTAKELHTNTILARDLHLKGYTHAIPVIEKVLAEHEHIYLTICLDVFAASVAPGVSAPGPLGLTPWQVLPLIEMIAKSKKVVGLDIAELSPPFDRDEQTAKLAACIVAAFVDWSV